MRKISPHDLELAVVMFALKIWRCYSYERNVIFLWIVKVLEYFFDWNELNMRPQNDLN